MAILNSKKFLVVRFEFKTLSLSSVCNSKKCPKMSKIYTEIAVNCYI